MGKTLLCKLVGEVVIFFSITRNHLVLFYSLFAIVITSSPLLILVKLDGKVMKVSTTTINYEWQMIATHSIFQNLQQ